jgi:geranylgeranyl reductase family protein
LGIDVVIVGAGPAGSVAALVLARAGVRVRLVDRARFPREKLCGDTLNPGSLALLDQLGVGEEIRARALPITGMTVTGPGGASVSADYGGGAQGAAIKRMDLDLLLVAAASAAGVQLDQEVRARAPITAPRDGRVAGVRVASGGREYNIHAPMVIAADGRASCLANALGLSRLAPAPRRWAHGAYFMGVAGQTTHGEMHVRREGYIGVAPLPCGLTNVCVVHERPTVKSAPRRLVVDAIACDPVLRERFTTARQVSGVTTLGPLAVDATGTGCPGLVLAGDAAGFIDPMTGDGLRFALRGGVLAAHAALHELQTGRPSHHLLAQARAREFARKWRVNSSLRALVGWPAGVTIAARVSTLWDWPVRYLVGVAGDVSLAGDLEPLLPAVPRAESAGPN